MAAIDVHTHMVSKEWFEVLREHGGFYTVTDGLISRNGTPFLTLTPEMFDYDMRLADMDKAGMDVSIVSLTCPNVFWGDADISRRAAILSNDDMTAAAARFPGRIQWLATLPWQYPDLAVAELDRCVAAGAVGVMVLGNIDGKSLTDPHFAPVWEAIDARGLPVLVHPTTPPGVEQMDLDKYHMAWSIGFPADTTIALARLILDGFFDRYAHVKIIGSHAGGTLPFLIARLDAGFDYFPSSREKIAKSPRQYLDRIWVDTITYSPRALEFTVAEFGVDHVLLGSDYPHKCGKMEEALQLVATLPSDQAELVRHENARALFGI
jgi:aminocarboxymuconate-semialdehyde decarboxylase